MTTLQASSSSMKVIFTWRDRLAVHPAAELFPEMRRRPNFA